MKLKNLVAITAVMLSLYSCSNDELGDLTGGKVPQGEVTIKAHMPSTADDSRASATLQDNKFIFAWQEGDAISVYNKSSGRFNNNRFDLMNGSEGVIGEFTGSLASEGNIDCAIYPYNENHNFYMSGSTPKRIVYLPSEYGSYEEDYNGNTNAPMYAEPVLNEDGSYDMSFKHLGAVIRLELKSVPAEAACVRISTGLDVDISGYFYVEYDSISENQYINVDRGYRNGQTYSIKFRPAIDIPELEGKSGSEVTRDMSFFFPVPTGEYKSLSFTLMDKNGQGLCHPYVGGEDGRPFTLSRADVAMYPTVTLVYTPEGLIAMDDKTMEFNELINQNDSIKLDKDIEIGAIAISKNFTIDCNGHKLSAAGISVDSGTLTIKDSDSENPQGKVNLAGTKNGPNVWLTVGPQGALKLDNLGMKSDYAFIGLENYGLLEMNDCYYECKEGISLSVDDDGSATITNSTIFSNDKQYNEIDIYTTGLVEFNFYSKKPSKFFCEVDRIEIGRGSLIYRDNHYRSTCKNIVGSKYADVKVYGGEFNDLNVLKYYVGGFNDYIRIRLEEDVTIDSPIYIDNSWATIELDGHTIINSTDSNINPATGEEDGGHYTCGFYVTGNSSLLLRDLSNNEGGISVNVKSNYDGIRRAIWVHDGDVGIRGGKYFSSQTNKNSKCEVLYIEKNGSIGVDDGILETDCYTGSFDSDEDIRYWVANYSDDVNSNLMHVSVFGDDFVQFVNFNPLHPNNGLDGKITPLQEYEFFVYDEDGNDITAEYKDKTYHEANMALKKGDKNVRITYKFVYSPTTSN